MRANSHTGKFNCYVPRGLLRRLALSPDDLVQTLEGTVVFVDVSGFTRLSERLARTGKEGAEQLTDAINACFSALLAEAHAGGGSLLKFGGDALLLWFEGEEHATRACASAAGMRSTLRRVGRISTGAGEVRLRMSAGVHSGDFHMFLVGESHREYVITGPASSQVVEMEGAASASQILLSPQTAALLPRRALGAETGPGVRLARSPSARLFAPDEEKHLPDDEAVLGCLSTEVRAHVLAAPAAPEHRTAVVSFVQFGGLDALIKTRGEAAAARALDALVKAVQEGTDLFQVCYLSSDVTADGGKLILTAGAPRAVGDDEERMLLTLRHILEQPHELPIRIGVNRGQVFAGEIGPPFRRTYSVMGDTVNLAARLMAKAPWESLYATEGVLLRSQTKFETSRLEPFMVKGKSQPIEAWEVGPLARPSATKASKRLPLIGRDAESAALRDAVEHAAQGRGSLVEIVGETGSGKSRLLAEAREVGVALRFVHATCESYRQAVPYFIWRDILRQLLGLGWDDPDEVVVPALKAEVESAGGELAPWLPLLGMAIDAQVPMTREVQDLGERFRTAKLQQIVLAFLAPALQVPTLLEIEHAHMMDEASAALLLALSKRLGRASWIVAVTRRDTETGFVAPESATRLELGALSPEAARELAESTPEAQKVPPHLLDEALERAGGSPEFLLDLLAAAANGSGTLPDSVDAATSARIDALAPGDRVLVRRASVLGLSFHTRRLRHVLDPAMAEPDEQTWKRLGVVFAQDPDGAIRFKRPALQEVAYETLPFSLRRELHASVAQAMEPDRGRDVDADPAVLSRHFALAGDNARAWKYALMGAERAEARFAQVDAARLYRRAVETGRKNGASPDELAACWEALGSVLQLTGELAAASQAVTAARKLVGPDRVAQARLLYQLTKIARRRDGLASAVRWANRGLRSLDGLEDQDARTWRARLLGALAFTRLSQNRLLDAEKLCREAIAEAEAVGEPSAFAYASYVLDCALTETGRSEQATHSPRALEIYEQLGDLEQQASVLNNMGVFASNGWRWDEALELHRRAAECYRRAGNAADLATTECNIGELLSARGLYDDAYPYLKRAQRVWKSTDDRPSAAYGNAMLGRLAVRAGQGEEGRALLREASAELRSFGEAGGSAFVDCLLCEAEAISGSPEHALAIAGRLLGLDTREQPLLHLACGIALVRLGDARAAARALRLSLSLARERGALYDIAAALDVLDKLSPLDAAEIRERDQALERLGVERLAEPDFGAQGEDGQESSVYALATRPRDPTGGRGAIAGSRPGA